MPGIAARVAGLVALVCATFGLLYNAMSLTVALRGGFAELVEQEGLTYFHPAFYAMSGFCVACYIVLLWCGLQLARLRLAVAPALMVLSAAELW